MSKRVGSTCLRVSWKPKKWKLKVSINEHLWEVVVETFSWFVCYWTHSLAGPLISVSTTTSHWAPVEGTIVDVRDIVTPLMHYYVIYWTELCIIVSCPGVRSKEVLFSHANKHKLTLSCLGHFPPFSVHWWKQSVTNIMTWRWSC